ncbi:MAG: HDOD domain-containing protein [Betaproteobacteria bacterium]|nr:HDOD domain-containing protein [Betaproteobacteria bacterium]
MERSEAFKNIVADAARGELNFPTSAKVALRVREVLDDPDCALDEAVRLVKAEPLMAARVVALANSMAFNPSGREIADVRAAVNRLGFKAVRAVAAAVATHQLAGTPTGQANRDRATKLWEHTAHVAALAHVIARRVTGQDPETAMFAGIVHEVGGFYLLSRAKDYPGLMDGELTDWLQGDDGEVEGEEEGKGGSEVEIGRAVLRALSVPRAVVDGIEAMWKGYLVLPPTTLGDTLLLADQLSPVHSPLHEPPLNDCENITANIDLIIGQETLVGILKESAEHMDSLIRALRF